MPYGQIQVDTVKDSLNNTFAPASSVFRNRIINGAMVIDQRNAGASVPTTTTGALTYTVDRFYYLVSVASKFTLQQNAGSVTPPTGFINYLGITSSSAYSAGTTESFNIGQPIEGLNIADLAWGTANAKTVTLSFWVYSSLTGTFAGSLRNSAVNRSYPFNYTISSLNTWTQIAITIPGDTSGTWLTNNGVGIYTTFNLGSGSSFIGTAGAWAAGNYTTTTAATSVVGTSGATFYITGIQLEVGSNATNFEYRPYGTELMLCQRYCYVQAYPNGNCRLFGFNYTTVTSLNSVQFPVTMRTSPTATISTASAFTLYQNGTTASVSTITLDGVSIYNANYAVGSSGLTQGGGSVLALNTAGNQLTLSAEL